MECLIGIKGRDFVLMATDCVAGRSIIAMKKGVLFYSVLLVMLYRNPTPPQLNSTLLNTFAARKLNCSIQKQYLR